MDTRTGPERFETVIIGGGQAGLAVGYHLAQRGRPAVILDAGERIGDAWRTRWDSLRLFSPAKHDGLPGMRFPAPRRSFPSKDEMADYLAAYASRFDLCVRNGVRVDGLAQRGDVFILSAADLLFEADTVVVATGACHTPRIPAFASELDPGIVQLHSCAYRNPSQLQPGGVLLVGAGNSGAEIGFELAPTRQTWIAGPNTGQFGVRHGSVPWRIGQLVVRFVGHHVLTKRNPIGRTVIAKIAGAGAPLIRVRPKDLRAAGVERVQRVVGVQEGCPLLEDGRVLDVANVIWCTGFREDFGWIDLPAFGEDGELRHDRGVVEEVPGLYFLGLEFLFAASSDVLTGMGRDAAYVARHIATRRPAPQEGRTQGVPTTVAT
jgi:putative flavoprotein involved in K+ transport